MSLTAKQREILTMMRDNQENEEMDYGELVYEKGQCYIGYEKVDSRILFGLVRLMAISLDQYSRVGGMERYHINGTGMELLKCNVKSLSA